MSSIPKKAELDAALALEGERVWAALRAGHFIDSRDYEIAARAAGDHPGLSAMIEHHLNAEDQPVYRIAERFERTDGPS